jgi:hypothetical protein
MNRLKEQRTKHTRVSRKGDVRQFSYSKIHTDPQLGYNVNEETE